MTYHIPREPDTWTPPAVRYTQPWVSGPDEMSEEEYERQERADEAYWSAYAEDVERDLAERGDAPALADLTDPDDLPFA